jgi:hypothetical protein
VQVFFAIVPSFINVAILFSFHLTKTNHHPSHGTKNKRERHTEREREEREEELIRSTYKKYQMSYTTGRKLRKEIALAKNS